jgi:hypothetical protein
MKLIIALLVCLGVSGCAEEYVVPPNVGVSRVANGTVQVCDDTNTCEEITSQYYYDGSNDLYYYDSGYWVGPGGYWYGNAYYRGYYPGYKGIYGRGYGVYHGGIYGGGIRGRAYGGARGGSFHSSVRGGSRGGHGGGHR